MISRIRGTRDIIDAKLFKYAINTIASSLKLHNYQEIITPIIEPLELFCRSLGTQTDVVSKEMFIVSSSSAQQDETRDAICLRPEMTASIARAFVEEGVQLVPWKVFSFGSCFRYERPQKGRYREFYQCSIEAIGVASVMQDVQMIAQLDVLFKEQFKLKDYVVHINFLGIQEERAAFKELLLVFLNEHELLLCETCKKRKSTNILRVFDCKNEACKEIYQKAPELVNSLGEVSQKEWQQIQKNLTALSVNFVYNPRLVRGLDYYNKTVFEFVSPHLGAQSTFCGGGRYDKLIAEISGKNDQPSVGAAIGLDRLVMLLEHAGNQLECGTGPVISVVLPLTEEQHGVALLLADNLVRAQKTVEVIFEGSVKSMMRKADKIGARYCLLIGQQEQESGTVLHKDMQTGQEQIVKQDDVKNVV